MMESLAESRFIEDIDYVFVQAEEMDIDECSYDDCDEAIIPSQYINDTSFSSTGFLKENSIQLVTETLPEIESSASIISLEDTGVKMEESLSLEGSITLFSEDNLPSLGEVEIEVQSPEELSNTGIVQTSSTAMEMTSSENNDEGLHDNDRSTSGELSTSTKNLGEKPSSKKETTASSLKSGCRLSNKKRRKQMKKQKKAIAAANAAVALAEMRSKSSETTKKQVTKSSNVKHSSIRPKKAGDASQIAVACATESLIAYRKQHNLKKKSENSINYVALL